MSGILGQLAPGAGSWEDLYLVPPNIIATLRVIVSNRAAVSTAFSVAVSKDGAAIVVKHEIASDKSIAENDTGATIGFVISAGDIVRVKANNVNLSFTATGETRVD